MKTKPALSYTWAVFIILLTVESWAAPKSKVLVRNWGPQSMLYLKGKYGRRYAAETDDAVYKIDLADWNFFLKSGNLDLKHQIPIKRSRIPKRVQCFEY
ncbi:spexin-like [Protopterus annectens]|uniref:spexin-like n=1 Tax=Protopterus annectens TaxID=7888 RepID=UPI001CF945BD|nr:spexin-like [Protopterus annectens]